jgi:hypothetical protein
VPRHVAKANADLGPRRVVAELGDAAPCHSPTPASTRRCFWVPFIT